MRSLRLRNSSLDGCCMYSHHMTSMTSKTQTLRPLVRVAFLLVLGSFIGCKATDVNFSARELELAPQGANRAPAQVVPSVLKPVVSP